MENYKRANYIFQTEDINGNLILCNFLQRTLYRYESSIKNNVLDVLNNIDCNKDDEFYQMILKDLISKKFIVPVDYDEKSIGKFYRLSNIFSPVLNLIIIPTYRCNFNCPYCYQDHKSKIMEDSLAEGIIKYIRKNISKYTEVHISWFGGEPLEAYDIVEKITSETKKICNIRYKKFSSSMTTNGYKLSTDTFEKLYNLNIRYYQITLDGTSDTHDKQRYTKDGGKTFDIILNNLINIKNKFPNKKFHIDLRTNVSVDVLLILNDYIKQMNNIFGNDNRFGFHFKAVGNWGGENISSFKDNLITNDPQKVYKTILSSKTLLNYNSDANAVFNDPICYAGKKNSFVLDPNGLIGKCTCDDLKDNNNIGTFDSNGNFYIDENKASKWIVIDEYEKCATCNLESKCMSSICPATHVTNTKRSKSCPDYKFNIELYLKLLALNDRYIETVKFKR